MKVFCLIVLIIGINLRIIQAQWISLNSNTTENLNHVQFLNDSVGFIVGNNGTVLKTIDYGNNWTDIFALNSQNFYSFFQLNIDTIYIGSTCFFRTDDGGLNWIFISDLSAKITDIYYKSSDMGFINKPWSLWKYENQVWEQVVYNSLYDLQFTSANVGYIVGEEFNSSPCNGFYKTVNGGNLWSYISPDTCFKISTYCFINDLTGYLVNTNNDLYITIDGSNSWSLINSNITNDSITDCIFINDYYGYFTSVSGNIYKTYNGGITCNIDFSVSDSLNFIAVTANYIYVVGNNGIVLRSQLSTEIKNHGISNCIFNAYPNPNNGTFAISTSGFEGEFNMTITNNLGEIVYTQRFDNYSHEVVPLNIKGVPYGIYYIQVNNDEISRVLKIVVK
ncbi:MAG: YCF48-related protein [Bacteroidota bacterium]